MMNVSHGSLPGEGATVIEELGHCGEAGLIQVLQQSRNPSACHSPCLPYRPYWIVMGLPREKAADVQLQEEMVGEQV